MASLLCAWTIIGFECSADVSEETINAQKVTPKGMLSAVLISSLVGFAFIFVMAISIPDVASVSSAPYPLAAIITYYLGSAGTNLFLAFALTSIFACSMVVMLTASRVLFAMARDNRFVAPNIFRKFRRIMCRKTHRSLSPFWRSSSFLSGDNLTLLGGRGDYMCRDLLPDHSG